MTGPDVRGDIVLTGSLRSMDTDDCLPHRATDEPWVEGGGAEGAEEKGNGRLNEDAAL